MILYKIRQIKKSERKEVCKVSNLKFREPNFKIWAPRRSDTRANGRLGQRPVGPMAGQDGPGAPPIGGCHVRWHYRSLLGTSQTDDVVLPSTLQSAVERHDGVERVGQGCSIWSIYNKCTSICSAFDFWPFMLGGTPLLPSASNNASLFFILMWLKKANLPVIS